MSRVLILLCLTLGIFMTGCGGDDKGNDDKGGDKGNASDKAASGSKDNTDKTEGSGEKATEPKKSDGSSVGKTGAMQMVSVKLPNMTCGGCEGKVRSALTEAGCFNELETDLKGKMASFKVSTSVDYKAKLDEIAAKVSEASDYEIVAAKSDGASLQNSGSSQFVSTTKTNDCCASKTACCKECETSKKASSLVTVQTADKDKK